MAVGMEAYMYKNQSDLARRVAFAWEVHSAPKIMAVRAQTAWDMVVAASRDAACVCGGRWVPMTDQFLQQQLDKYPSWAPPEEAPSSVRLRLAIRAALQGGCDKGNNIYIYGPKDAGKSHVLKPLGILFGKYAFVRPVGKKSNYPLQEIFDKKVCVLQDFRTSTYQMGFDDLLVWFEGEKFVVPLPQNTNKGDKLYDQRAPVFISAGSKLRIPLKEASTLQVDPDEQNVMMDGRFRFFFHPVAVTNPDRTLKPCPRCFAEWMCSPELDDMQCSPCTAPDKAPEIHQVAMDALLDWLETHGGKIFFQGPHNNLASVSDGVGWGSRFHGSCGRLLPFLLQFGRRCATDCNVIDGFVL